MEFNNINNSLVDNLINPIFDAKASKKVVANNPIFDKLIELSQQTNQIHSLYLELFSNDGPALNTSNITSNRNNDDQLKIYNYLKCEQCDWKLLPQRNIRKTSKKQTIKLKQSEKENLIKSKEKNDKENLIENKKYSCNLCDKLYKSKENLNLHHLNIHLNLKPYSCKMCTKRFSHRNGKIYHEKYIH